MQRYWSLERLKDLVEVLKRLAICQGGQSYLGPDVTAWTVHQALCGVGFRHVLSETHEGLNVLLHHNVLAPGQGGPRKDSYRRAFYPDAILQVTPEQLAEYYGNRTPPVRPVYQQPDDPSAPLAPGVLPGMEFWTAARLSWLVGLLRQVAHRDRSGWYFGPTPMRATAAAVLQPYGYSKQHVDTPLHMLVFLGVLDPGKAGPKKPDYRRRFRPDTAITDEGVALYRQRVRERS